MQDSFPIPSCFNSGTTSLSDDRSAVAAATKSGHSVVMSVYRTKIGGASRLITVTWCRGLSVSVEGSDVCEQSQDCKVELRPWYFWRKYGSKKLNVEGIPVNVFWDLRNASFTGGEPEPRSGYYVAVITGDEVILLVGDLNKDAYRRTRCRPSLIEPALVSKQEHVFGKRRFATRAKFHDKGRLHEISIECMGGGNAGGGKLKDPEMVFKIDGHVAIHVKHLQWKFRGNHSISLNKSKVEVYWDVHDWLFSPGLRHALFIFKPSPVTTTTTTGSSSSSSSSSMSPASTSLFTSSVDGGEGGNGGGRLLSGFSLFLYAWKLG